MGASLTRRHYSNLTRLTHPTNSPRARESNSNPRSKFAQVQPPLDRLIIAGAGVPCPGHLLAGSPRNHRLIRHHFFRRATLSFLSFWRVVYLVIIPCIIRGFPPPSAVVVSGDHVDVALSRVQGTSTGQAKARQLVLAAAAQGRKGAEPLPASGDYPIRSNASALFLGRSRTLAETQEFHGSGGRWKAAFRHSFRGRPRAGWNGGMNGTGVLPFACAPGEACGGER